MGLPTAELVEGSVVIVPASWTTRATDCSVVEVLFPQAYRFWAVRPYRFKYSLMRSHHVNLEPLVTALYSKFLIRGR